MPSVRRTVGVLTLGAVTVAVLSLPTAAPSLAACAPGTSQSGSAPDGLTSGLLRAPYPTARGISLTWPITGDADVDATATLRYRKAGGAWRTGMPLIRVPAGRTGEGFRWVNRFAGSILETSPGTSYDVQVSLSDPDGGCAVSSLRVTTPQLPAAPTALRVRKATPRSLDRLLASARPGDRIRLRNGRYDGFAVNVDGTKAAPIVITGSRKAVVRGEIGLFNRSHVQVSGLTVRGRIRANGSSDVVITGNRVSGNADGGIQAVLHSRRAYIADNVVVGSTKWRRASVGADGDNSGEGIVVTGPGHVVERNKVKRWRDCLSTMEDGEAWQQSSIDFRRNDLRQCADDAIEVDFCMGNCRVVGNRILNAFVAMSSQPGLGGPTYFVRNTAYNVLYVPFKLYRGSVGDVIVHNTIVKRGDAFNIYSGAKHRRTFVRNNIFIGGPAGDYGTYDGGNGAVLSLDSSGAGSSYDYDGFGTVARRFKGSFRGRRFGGLRGLRSTTTEKHAVRVGLGVFARKVAYPRRAFRIYRPRDLRLSARGAGVDAGVALTGWDGWTGAAPDLGAVEHGRKLPAVGPRG